MPTSTPAPDHLPVPEDPWLAEDPEPPWWVAQDVDPPPVCLTDDPWLADDPAPRTRHPAAPLREPIEVLKAGRWDRARGDGGGFAAGGLADHLPPGPVLAGLAADRWHAGLGRLSDDELIGVLRAARRLTSWAAAMELAAVGDLWRRRTAEEDAGDTGAAAHADAELAAALTLTRRAADHLLALSAALHRLPATRAALAAGQIDLPRVEVIADELTGLTHQHAAAVEQAVIGAAPGQTTGQLRAATRRAVLATDPDAVKKRKEQALREARVERWTEPAGTAALAGRDLPPAGVLAADANLTALARQLKAAGAEGTLDTLRAQIYLALLSGTPPTALLPATPGRDFPGDADPDPPVSGRRGGNSGATRPDGGQPTENPGQPTDNYGRPTDSGHRGWPSLCGTVVGRVNLTVPLATWLGQSDAPGHVPGYGPLDATDARTLADALAAQVGTKWCLTFTGPDGRPLAHGCARAGPPPGRRPPLPGSRSRAGPQPSSRARARPQPSSRARARPQPSSRARARPQPGSRDGPQNGAGQGQWTCTVTALTGGCDHALETPAYQPTPTLRHLAGIRHNTCVFPGCRRPAAQCDNDHTIPYDQGGKTCLCNLAPLCRHHHQVKQAPGWTLTQTSPGTLTWTTPSGRRYINRPE